MRVGVVPVIMNVSVLVPMRLSQMQNYSQKHQRTAQRHTPTHRPIAQHDRA